MNNDPFYYNLLRAFAKGCPICIVINQNTTRLIDDLLYERVNDPITRKRIRESLGFCSRHAWQVQEAGDVLGHSIIYADILSTLTDAAQSLGHFESIYTEKQICLFCEQEREVEQDCLNKFIDCFYDIEFQQAYIKSNGLCLPHIQAVLKQTKNEKFHKDLLELEKEKLNKLVKELKELTRRFDYRFSKEESGQEKDAWIRAVEKISGSKKT